MIQPIRAPVRPRVVSSEIGDAMPLEDVLQECERSPAEVIEIVGGPGSGKSTALAHLAAVAPPGCNVLFLDAPSPASVSEASKKASVVFASPHSLSAPGAVSYRLQPWGDDEVLEYLLAMHPAHCRSVMTRLQTAPDRRLPQGRPELWRVVLDRMAEEESLESVTDALRLEIQRMLSTADRQAEAEMYCLAMLTERFEAADGLCGRLRKSHADPRSISLIRHTAVQLMLAGDRLTRVLETESGYKCLEQRLPRELVEIVAKAASPAGLQSLSKWIAEGPQSCHAMVASLLHAANTGWQPRQQPLPLLSGAYLNGAAWKGVNLAGAKIDNADLSNCDFTEAVLKGASANGADFRESVLHCCFLVEFQGTGANFEAAVLTSANAHFAILKDAILARADLSGSCLRTVDLRGADLTDARLVRTDLTCANLLEASINGADFSGADLRWSYLDHLPLCNACFTGAIFSRASLRGADLTNMNLPKADFAKAHLQGALLTGSRMPAAGFVDAGLQSAGLADVEWEDVDLRRANLKDCTFHLGSTRSGLVGSPIACEGSRTGFYGDEFDQQTYRAPEEIRKANLCRADLRGANIEGIDFYLVDLRGAKYDPEQFQHLRRCGAILFDKT
jgi:uncharacterized protein YjbI with pentapeptide repeats